jgi:hypothetical protein
VFFSLSKKARPRCSTVASLGTHTRYPTASGPQKGDVIRRVGVLHHSTESSAAAFLASVHSRNFKFVCESHVQLLTCEKIRSERVPVL